MQKDIERLENHVKSIGFGKEEGNIPRKNSFKHKRFRGRKDKFRASFI